MSTEAVIGTPFTVVEEHLTSNGLPEAIKMAMKERHGTLLDQVEPMANISGDRTAFYSLILADCLRWQWSMARRKKREHFVDAKSVTDSATEWLARAVKGTKRQGRVSVSPNK